MASRDYTRHTVSSTAPAIARVGDEYYNPTTNTLYKSVAYNGTTVQWEAIPVAPNGTDYTISGNLTTIGTETVGNLITTNGVFWSNGVSALASYGNTQLASNLNAGGNAVTTITSLSVPIPVANATVTLANSASTITTTGFIQSPTPIVAPIKPVLQGTGVLGFASNISVGSNQPYCASVDPTGNYLFVGTYTGKSVVYYSINQTTGALTQNGSMAAGTLAQQAQLILCEPSGRFFYVLTLSTGGSGFIGQYSVSSGNPVSLGADIGYGNSFPLAGGAIDPTGRFLYAATGGASIQAFWIKQTTGLLASIGTFSTVGNVYTIVCDPTGRFLFAGMQSSGVNYVQSFAINPNTGAPTSIMSISYSASNLYGMAIDPTGRFLYTTSSSAGTVQQYAINQVTGKFTSITTDIAAGTQPQSCVCDPTGRYLYVGNYSSNNISMYSINQATGALTSIATAIASGGTNTAVNQYGMAIDPSGRFVYAVGTATASLTSFTTNNFSAATGSFIGNLSINGNVTGNTVLTSVTEATVTNGSSGSTFTLSLANGTFQTITWTANCTVTMPAVTSGKSFTLLANTGTPGPYITTTFTGVRWPGGTAPTITATANKADVFSFISDGVYWYGFYNQNY